MQILYKCVFILQIMRCSLLLSAFFVILKWKICNPVRTDTEYIYIYIYIYICICICTYLMLCSNGYICQYVLESNHKQRVRNTAIFLLPSQLKPGLHTSNHGTHWLEPRGYYIPPLLNRKLNSNC